MSINFSGLHRSIAVPGNSTAASHSPSGERSTKASVQHQFAASAGLSSRKGLQPGHKLPPPRNDALRSKLAQSNPRIAGATPTVGPPSTSAPVSVPPAEVAFVRAVTPLPHPATVTGHVAAAAAPSAAAAPMQINAQVEPPPAPSFPVPGQPAVFAWLPMQRSSERDALAATSVQSPRFQWARPAI